MRFRREITYTGIRSAQYSLNVRNLYQSAPVIIHVKIFYGAIINAFDSLLDRVLG
jgi:hypothetical protein